MSKSDVLAAIHDLQTSLNHHFLSTQMLFHQFIPSMDTHLAHLDSSIPKSEFPISSSSSQIWNSSPTTQDPLSNFTEIPLSPPSLSFHSPHPLASPPTPLLISFSSCSFPSPPPSPVIPASHHQILISPSSPQSFSITTALRRTKPFPQPLVATPSLSRSARIGDVVTMGGISSLHSTPASPPASRLQPPPPPTPPDAPPPHPPPLPLPPTELSPLSAIPLPISIPPNPPPPIPSPPSQPPTLTPPVQRVSTTPPTSTAHPLLPIQSCSPAEIKENRDRGLGYNGNQKWSSKYRCHSRFLLFVGSEDEIVSDAPEPRSATIGDVATTGDISGFHTFAIVVELCGEPPPKTP